MRTGSASRTAVLVCQGRAVAHGGAAAGRFSDSTALGLLRAGERELVEQVRAGTRPRGWADRVQFELVRACAEVVVPRTVAIDDAVRARPAPQVVILGAGLDGRAWRMPELGSVDVYEVDHPDSQQDKRERVGDRQALAASLTYVAVDLTRDSLAGRLAAAGHRVGAATTWIWEGVVPYLTKRDVAATLAVVAAHSAPGSRLIVNYQSREVAASIGRLAVRAMTALARRGDPLAGEPRRSSWTPEAMRTLLTGQGFTVISDEDLLTRAERLGRPVRQRVSLRTGRVAVADR